MFKIRRAFVTRIKLTAEVEIRARYIRLYLPFRYKKHSLCSISVSIVLTSAQQ